MFRFARYFSSRVRSRSWTGRVSSFFGQRRVPIFLSSVVGGGLTISGFFPPASPFESFISGSGKTPASPLMEAVSQNDSGAIERLVKEGTDPNERHSLGWAPLHIAAFWGNYEAAEKLLELGADPDIVDRFTSAAEIAMENPTEFLEAHLERQDYFGTRLNPNVSFAGMTALHYAVLMGQERVMELLLEKGADPGLRNASGHSAKDYASNEKVAKRLEQEAKLYKERKKAEELEERRRYPLEMRLKERIIGQEGAISTVASAIRRKQNGWIDEDHPLVFIFLGSSGIGKTELAKSIASYLHKDLRKGFIRIDMSEYQQKHEVAKFIGSPPGYVGHEDGGQLTKKLKECPDAVVLFDEIEKAHPDILTIMLQLFDEGRLTDGKGNTVECKNAIFIMTSNLASEVIADHAVQLREAAASVTEAKREQRLDAINLEEKIEISKKFKEKVVQPILKRHFKRDEFLGRINEMVYFLPFSAAELQGLVRQELELWRVRARNKHKIELSWDEDVVAVLVAGYNLRYGARSIKYEVERKVVNKLAAAHERQLLTEGSLVKLCAQLKNKQQTDDLSSIPIELEIKVVENNSGLRSIGGILEKAREAIKI